METVDRVPGEVLAPAISADCRVCLGLAVCSLLDSALHHRQCCTSLSARGLCSLEAVGTVRAKVLRIGFSLNAVTPLLKVPTLVSMLLASVSHLLSPRYYQIFWQEEMIGYYSGELVILDDCRIISWLTTFSFVCLLAGHYSWVPLHGTNVTAYILLMHFLSWAGSSWRGGGAGGTMN